MIQSDLYGDIEKTYGNDMFVTQVSQMAAYQAKQDYGFDLAQQVAANACGQLAYKFCTLLQQYNMENLVNFWKSSLLHELIRSEDLNY